MARKNKKSFDDDELAPNRRAKSRVQDDDEDGFEDASDDRKDRPAGPKDDAYTGLLLVSLFCLIAASVFLFLDQGELTSQSLTAPNVTVPALANSGSPSVSAADAAKPAANE